MAGSVRTGGKGTMRRKKKAVHKANTNDDKRLQSTLKRIGVNAIPAIEELNIFKEDAVIQFLNPKVQASIAANTWVVSGSPQTKKLQDILPQIIHQLGPDNLEHLKKLAEQFQNQASGAAAGSADGAAVAQDDDDDVPQLVPALLRSLEANESAAGVPARSVAAPRSVAAGVFFPSSLLEFYSARSTRWVVNSREQICSHGDEDPNIRAYLRAAATAGSLLGIGDGRESFVRGYNSSPWSGSGNNTQKRRATLYSGIDDIVRRTESVAAPRGHTAKFGDDKKLDDINSPGTKPFPTSHFTSLFTPPSVLLSAARVLTQLRSKRFKMNVEKLQKMAGSVRTGGKGTMRRKKKAVHKANTNDDKRLQSTLKRIGVNAIPAIEELNIFKEDAVIQFLNPKVQASIAANTWVVSGSPQTKKLQDILPQIIHQLGPDNLEHLKKLAEQFQNQASGAAAGSADGAAVAQDDDDDVPQLVPGETFEAAAEDHN
ncbi:unnamed protein product [Cuscuta campestris]|uniref:Nascent polypeptide-associated complex subunit beta n=1 Tax=Cuscuta campestris TaxID=132261 RepID=A0A484KWE5_9ASTE|nr:unnamed protein product [Cuscuta campestris]